MSMILIGCGAGDYTEQNTMDSMAEEMANPYPHIPGAITAVLMKDYPNVSGVEWETTDSLYIASFIDNGLPVSVMYRTDGVRYGVKGASSLAMLPKDVQKAVATLGMPEKVYKLHLADGDIRYEVFIGSKVYLYDASGSMIAERNLEIEEETE